MENKTIDFYSFEEITSRMERTNVRLWIMCIILILALICTNLGWVYYENSFTDTEVTQDIEASSDNNSDLNVRTIGGNYYGSTCED